MPLHGKIVVMKRSGGDGTEFPLTASCLFGRKPDCDIRIQLPQVSKEHCRIDLNENKEVILTNLSSANPTRVNGEVLKQSERLKHGDVITIIDRSFRFEYPPAPTPKKRSAIGGKTETLKILQDQQVGDTPIVEKGEKRFSEVSTEPCLKDGANHDNIQQSLEKTAEVESKADDGLLQGKTNSPFSDLYQMIKKSLDVKTPRKSSTSQLETPSSRFCSPKPDFIRKNSAVFTERKSTPKTSEVLTGVESISRGTPASVKKQIPLQVPATEMAEPPRAEKAENGAMIETTSPQRRNGTTPEKFTVSEVIEQVTAQTPSPVRRRRSKEGTPGKTAVTQDQGVKTNATPKAGQLQRASPKNPAEKGKQVSKKRKSGELGEDVPTQQTKRKRVSFGGYLSPELFDKRLPPDSPLRKGATPRRSLSLFRPKESLLRRASVIGLLKELDQNNRNVKSPAKKRTPSPKNSASTKTGSPKTPASLKKSPKPRSPSPAKKSPKPRSPSPAKKSPKSRSPSPAKKSPKPRSPSPAKKSPKSRSPSPAKKSPKSRSPSPAKKSPKSRSPSPAKKSPKSRSPSPAKKSPKPRSPSPAKKSPKSRSPSPAKKSPKSRSPSPKAASSAKNSPKSKSPSPARGSSPSKNKVVPSKTTEQLKTQRRASTPGQIPYKQVPTGKRRASLGESDTSKERTPAFVATPAKTPTGSGVQTPTVKGRFSVSRISTPSPTTEADMITDQVRLSSVTPKTHMGRKSTTQKTPGTAKSAVKMHRRSGISRASIKVTNPWAHVVKFGQPKAQVVAPPKKTTVQRTKKKAVPKPKTPARNLKGYASTGHADSPATIVVGRAHRQTIVQPTGAAPRVITNVALLKKSMKMDEDLTGISEMFKTPVNERKRKSSFNDSSATKTPAGGQSTSVMEPSVLNTPEEPGEMVVSPLSVTSAVKGRRYNSEAVQRLLDEAQESSFLSQIQSELSEQQNASSVTTPKQKPELPDSLTGMKRTTKTPKQKPEQQECLTGVKRIVKTPRQKAEPVEDLRGKILKTPKQRVQQQECLTGVKRIMKTPRQKVEPLEDIRGKLLKTPKQKPEQQECLTGVKRIFRTPKQKAEPLEDLRGKILKTPKAPEGGDVSLDGVKELLQTPAQMQESDTKGMKTPKTKRSPVVHLTGIKRIMKTPNEKTAPVEDMVGVKRLMRTPKQKGEPVEANFGIKRLMKSPRLRGNAPVEDFEGLQELMAEPLNEPTVHPEAKEGEDQVSLSCGEDVARDFMETISQAAADEKVLAEEPEVKTAAKVDATATDLDHKKKSVRGRRAKTVESQAAQDQQEAPDSAEDTVIPAPSRGRRGKKTEATAPPTVRKTTRGRNAKTPESAVVELTEESHPQSPKVAPKPKRGRNAQKSSADQSKVVNEPEGDQSQPADVEENANESATPVEKTVPKRGRKAKQAKQTVPQQQYAAEDVPQATGDANVACSDQPERLPGGADEEKSSDAMKTILQAPQTESLPHVQTPASVQKKSVRGRRAKQVESEEPEAKQEAAEIPEEPIVPTPVRARRGKKIEATAPPAARHTSRGRSAKSQESMSKESATETQVVTESVQTCLINASQEKDSAPQIEEAVMNPLRGRRTKQTPAEPPQSEPENTDTVSGEYVENAGPRQPILPTAGKPRRGRQPKQDTVEQKDAVDLAAVKARQQSRPPARVKRGRNAKQDEEKMDDEPAKKIRRSKKSEQEQAELTEEAQSGEMVVSEKAEAPLAEPVQISEQATKPRRGGRKAKQDAESVDSIEVQEVPVVNFANKPKRGRRGKQEAEATAENPEHKEEKNAELPAPVMKSTRGKGVRAAAKCEISQAVPAKRARRGTAVTSEETKAESTALVSEAPLTSVEPAKKGRRAALKATTDKPVVTSDQKDLEAVENDAKMPKRCVKWKSDLEIFEFAKATPAKATPAKAVRGRKSKAADQVDGESRNVSKDANKTEEEDLSDQVVDSQPVKRAGRAPKAAGKVEPANEPNKNAETQLKTRRGRSAKK